MNHEPNLIPVSFGITDETGAVSEYRQIECRSVPRINEAVSLSGVLCEVQEVTHEFAESGGHVIRVALRKVG